MICADSSFLIDLMRGAPAAIRKAEGIQESGHSLAVPAPCVAELIRGSLLAKGRNRGLTQELLENLEVLPLDFPAAQAAGEMAAETASRGNSVPLLDCMIAAIARNAELTLLTRDPDFARIPGLSIETY
jgi:tRNA(fMet)-specific endonuclease VapC